MKAILKKLRNFLSDQSGSATLEWTGISAVVFIAAVLITAFILQSADGLGNAVAGQMDDAAAQIEGDQGG